MTYLDLIRDADRQLDDGRISLGEYEKMIEPLNREIQPEPCDDDPRADIYYLAEKIGIHQLYALVVELRGEPEPCEDAVSRQAALDAIEKAKMAQTPYGEIYVAKYNAEMNIQLLPATQPEMIRCKNCRFNDGTAYCVFHFRDVKGDDFCSWAERRTDG